MGVVYIYVSAVEDEWLFVVLIDISQALARGVVIYRDEMWQLTA